nr:MAG TPA: hypothetical protein [Caudoviricetes sp.]
MLPAQSPGAFSINNQLITLNLRTFLFPQTEC